MKNKKLLGIAAFFAIPMLFACKTSTNSLTYKGQNEFLIDNDQINFTMELKDKLKDGETISDTEVSGEIQSENVDFKSSEVKVLDKTVSVNMAFENFKNDSYYYVENLKFKVLDNSKQEVCACTIKNFKVSWIGYGEAKIKAIFHKISANKDDLVIPFKCMSEVNPSDTLSILVDAELPTGVTLTNYSAVLDENTVKATFNFSGFSTTENQKVTLNILIYTKNTYGIVTSYGIEDGFEYTHLK